MEMSKSLKSRKKVKEATTYKDDREVVIANKITVADTFFKRLVGLLGTKNLPPGVGLLISPCRQVHTFFMFYSLDIIFLDSNNNIVHLIKEMPPFRFSPYVKKSVKVLELPPKTIEQKQIEEGDIVYF